MERLLEYISQHPILVSLAVATGLLALVYEIRARTQSFAAVGPMEAVRLMNQGAVLVDVRAATDFRAGHIGNARNVAGGDIAAGAEALAKFKDKVVITCCETGMTSGSAARHLTRLGFKQVFNLRGGLAAWRQENLPVVKD